MLVVMAIRGEQHLIPRITIHGWALLSGKEGFQSTNDQGYAHMCQPVGFCWQVDHKVIMISTILNVPLNRFSFLK